VRNYVEGNVSQAEVACYPNPAGAELNVIFQSPPESKVNFAVYDAMGRLMEEASIQISWVKNPFRVNTSMLSPGLYVLVMNVSGLRYVVRFVKL
jgi:hypothetical protein